MSATVPTLEALLRLGAVKVNPFPPNSRYVAVGTATREENGHLVVYLKRRFVPPPENFALVQEYTVRQGDRLDNVAAQYLGDPELFWRLADANGAIRPEDLTKEPGSTIRITLPEGVPGNTGD